MPLTPRCPLLVRASLGVTVLLAVVAAPGAGADPSGLGSATDAARGRVFTDLVQADDLHCGGQGWYLRDHPEICTHGPDVAPEGIDVRTPRSTEELQAAGAYARAESGAPATEAGATTGTAVAPTDGSGAIVCEGDGRSGARTQVLYVRASDVASRFAALTDAIGGFMLAMDGVYNASARETGGSRHLRFVTEPSSSGGCRLSLEEVVLSPTGDDSFNNTVSEVKAAGWDASRIGQPRRFLMLVDAKVLCGVGQVYNDDQPGQSNLNDVTSSMYSRADQGCWNYAEPHELMHNLGGVQLSAPHSTGAFHCNDEYDIECYDDGGPRADVRYDCDSGHAARLDCNHDDYFHTDPPVGSYLHTHWNTARSRFLIDPYAGSSGSGSTTTTGSGGETRTERLSGVLRSSGSTSLYREVAPGPTRADATGSLQVSGFTRDAPITVRISDSAGRKVGSGSGTGSVSVSYSAPTTQVLTWTISGSVGTEWSLTLTYSV